MVMPPKKPIAHKNGEQYDYFQYLLQFVSDSVETDGFHLDFAGYEQLTDEIRSLNPNDFEKAWQLGQECNAWSEYLSDCISNIQRAYRDLETEKLAVFATASSEADGKSVSNGDRLANKNVNVIDVRKRRNRVEALVSCLEKKQLFLERTFYFCKSTCEWAKFKPTTT